MDVKTLALLLFLSGVPVAAVAAGSPAPEKADAPASKAAPAAAAPAAKPAEAGAAGGGITAKLQVPLFSERFASVPVAAVDDEVITLSELNDALTATHEARTAGAHAKGKDFGPVLDRLVDMRLLVLEARDMELDQLDDVKKVLAEFKQSQLRLEVENSVTKGLKPDPMEVEQAYREAVREWKLRSLLFAQEADAAAFAADAKKGGKSFDELAKAAVAAKKATGGDEAAWYARGKMVPQLAEAVMALDQGAVGGPVPVQGGFAVVHVDEVRYPDDPRARAKAEGRSLERRRFEALTKFGAELEKKTARIDKKLLDALDYEKPKPGFGALSKDKRVLVRIADDEPITVGEFSQALAKGFFHGIEEPIKEKRANAKKWETLKQLLGKRLFLAEAKRRRIAESAEYRNAVADFERQQLFTKILAKGIAADLKVTEAEGQKYYEEHKAEFSSPALYKLEGVAFPTASAAQAALKRLQGGTEFKWLRQNADGQVKLDDQVMQLEGTTFTAESLPAQLQTVLAGAGRGDYKLCEAAPSQFYVVHVIDAVPPAPQPYTAVRSAIGKKLWGEALSKALKDYAAKLRKAHRVDVYITGIGG
jgi:hypothetical protein